MKVSSPSCGPSCWRSLPAAVASYPHADSYTVWPGTNINTFVSHDALKITEMKIVKPGRALLERWGINTAQAVVKGYWKRGEAEYHAPH